MELKELERNSKLPKKIAICVRVTLDVSEWMKENNISPTKLIEESARELMKK